MKKSIKVILLLFYYVFLVCVCGEIFTRVSVKHKAIDEMDAKKFRCASNTFHHGFVPKGRGRNYTKEFRSVYLINSFGIRDKEYTFERLPQTFRILVFGDSFTEGYGVNIEDTFSKHLEALLNNYYVKPHFEVLNFGCASYSPILEYILLKEKGLRLKPDLVILFLDYSDFKDDFQYSSLAQFNSNKEPVSVRNPEAHMEKKQLEDVFFIGFFKKHSVFFNYIYLKIKKNFQKRDVESPAQKIPQVGDVQSDTLWMFRDKIYDYDADNKQMQFEGTKENIKNGMGLTLFYLTMFNRLLDANNINFLLVIYPYCHQIEGNCWPDGRGALHLEQDKLYNDFYKYEEIINEFAVKNQITLLSLYNDMKDSKIGPLFYDIDGHFNKNGHQLIASELFEYLKNSGF